MELSSYWNYYWSIHAQIVAYLHLPFSEILALFSNKTVQKRKWAFRIHYAVSLDHGNENKGSELCSYADFLDEHFPNETDEIQRIYQQAMEGRRQVRVLHNYAHFLEIRVQAYDQVHNMQSKNQGIWIFKIFK